MRVEKIQSSKAMLSRQVLSSPFDVPQRPRSAASRQGDRKRVKEQGSTLKGGQSANNIMVDSRVVRRSTLMVRNKNEVERSSGDKVPGCILFDSRLIKGDIFANPIVTVTGGSPNKKQGRPSSSHGHRVITTPPPVKGRRHVSVQTDEDEDDTMEACPSSLSLSTLADSFVQTDICCTQQNKKNAEKENEVPSTAKEETCQEIHQINNLSEPT